MTNGIATPQAVELSRCRADRLIGWLREYASDRISSRLIDERRRFRLISSWTLATTGSWGCRFPKHAGAWDCGMSITCVSSRSWAPST